MDNIISPVQREMPVITPVQPVPEARPGDKNLMNQSNSDQTKDERSKSGHQHVNMAELVEKVKTHVQSFSTKIAFNYDEKLRQSVIVVTDIETGKIIRQIPEVEMVELMEKMEEIAGIIFNGRA